MTRMPQMGSIERSELNYQAKSFAELTENELAAWRQLLVDNREFRSPFFSPGYTQLVSRCVNGVMVGLLKRQKQVVGVFPFQLEDEHLACPVGTVFCDYQAVITAKDTPWSVEELLEVLNLKQWRFDHALAHQAQWQKYKQCQDVSWSIDLSNGFSAYEAQMRQSKRKQLAETRRKKRLIEREVGPLSFVAHEVNEEHLDRMLQWKSAQWARSGWPGRYIDAWERQLMHELMHTEQADFAGLFTILKANEQPIAMHLGMRSVSTWHYWTTAYDPAFRRYSPGIIMLVEMLRHAPEMGLTEMDLGKEDFEYKRRLHTHLISLCEGVAKDLKFT